MPTATATSSLPRTGVPQLNPAQRRLYQSHKETIHRGLATAMEVAQAQAETARLQKVIESGKPTTLEVGQALHEIKSQRLYEEEHGSWDQFCRAELKRTRQGADQLILLAEISATLPPSACRDLSLREAEVISRVPEADRAAFMAEADSRGARSLSTLDALQEEWEQRAEAPARPPTPRSRDEPSGWLQMVRRQTTILRNLLANQPDGVSEQQLHDALSLVREVASLGAAADAR